MCSASLVMRNGEGGQRGINSPGGMARGRRARERMDASEPGTTTCFGSRNMDRQRPRGEEREAGDLLEGKGNFAAVVSFALLSSTLCRLGVCRP